MELSLGTLCSYILMCGALSWVLIYGVLLCSCIIGMELSLGFLYVVPSLVSLYNWYDALHCDFMFFCLVLSLVFLFMAPSNRPVQADDVVFPARMEMPRLRFPDHQKTSTTRTLPAASKARAMRILFLTNAHNGMSQALYLKLTEQGHQVTALAVSARKRIAYSYCKGMGCIALSIQGSGYWA